MLFFGHLNPGCVMSVGKLADDYVFLLDDLAEVDEGVAHSAEGGIDAHIGDFSDVFEADVLVDAHFEDFALLFRQQFHERGDFSVDLFRNQLLLG